MNKIPCPFCGQIHVDAMSECADGLTSRHNDESIRLTAHIEHLEDLLNGYRNLYADMCDDYVSLKAVKRSKEHCKRDRDNWKARALKAEAERDALLAERTLVDIVFDGPPSHESGRFIDVENMSGASVGIGEWIDRGNGYWALRIPTTTSRG